MDRLEKTVRYSELLNIYKNLLSDTQKDILSEYFHYDLSISEIALNRQISRAAVEDALNKGVKKMESLEQELHLYDRREVALKNITELKKKLKNKEDLQLLEEIERTIG